MNENDVKYLYGAAVQGIQDFIFQTNKLKEIAGASELVAKICTTAFDCYAINGISIVRAAGNIKFLFDNKTDCEKAVLNFPRDVMQMAPGVTVSQAVVAYSGNKADFKRALIDLDDKLQAQRNKPMRSVTLGLTGISRSRSTGFPAIKMVLDADKKEELLDEGTSIKKEYQNVFRLCKKSFGLIEETLLDENLVYELDDIVNKNNWIAVIHADGNGLRHLFRKVGEDPDKLTLFSNNLDKATVAAANQAFKAVIPYIEGEKIPIRPIVLGGDDMSLICRADLAIKYMKAYLKAFQIETKNQLSELKEPLLAKGLTACAGIAFVKSSYPFHYAIKLAEELCGHAKKESGRVASCIMFHKVQDSFVEDFKKIQDRELTTEQNVSYKFGPYYLNAEKYKENSIDKLEFMVRLIQDWNSNENKNKSGIHSALRQWLGTLSNDKGEAIQRMRRILLMTDKGVVEALGLKKYETDNFDSTPFYDVLSLLSVERPINIKEEKI